MVKSALLIAFELASISALLLAIMATAIAMGA